MYRCTVIGLSDSHDLWLSPEVRSVIANGKVFSGGKRHHELVAGILPHDALWIDVTVPLDDVFKEYERHEEIVVFASGDPLFYGLANTILRVFPEVSMKVYPSFNSLQMLAHRMNMPYNELHAVSLTGRPWDKFDEALINGEEMIGCLTDRRKTPHAIVERMSEYGYDNYEVFVGENLGNEKKERIGRYDRSRDYDIPNCMILKQTRKIPRRFGIPDNEFHLLNGRAKMITKMPVRLATIAALELHDKESLWDVGFCTGSISIEARLCNPRLKVTAFEIREEGRQLMSLNSRKFHAPGIETIIGDFNAVSLEGTTPPDAVFIGGYGGKMKEMIKKIHSCLRQDGCIVFNSVSEESRNAFIDITTGLGMTTEICHTIKVDDNNPITILKAK